ncbi:MAG: S1 RNA-binding domain-containing protein [Oscillibacter sp.]
MNTYKVGDVANVRIVKLMTFGAFAEVVPGVDGLIHISQIADRRIDKPDVLSEGQMVDAKITAIDEEKKKISSASARCSAVRKRLLSRSNFPELKRDRLRPVSFLRSFLR